MAMNLVKLPTGKPNLQLRVSKGHYATSHSHINYYIDVTLTKFRLSEARAAAQELVRGYRGTTIIDTILCLDGTEVIGACMGSELTKAGYSNMNAHQTIYVVTPEHTTGSQLIFRENTAPMIQNKHVLVLAASVTTGYTVQGAVEAIRYYGGEPAGVTGAAGLKKLCEEGVIGAQDTVVSVITGNGLKDVANAIKFCGDPMHLPNDLDELVEEFDKRGISVE